MKRFDLDDFKPNTNYVIEASAGTGKTYNIVEIVKKLVNNHHFALNEILVVTYTEKAAGELKDRIRKELKDEDVDNAPIYTIHSFCQNTIKEFGISASLPLSLNVINDEDLRDFADRYVREGDILKDISSFASVSFFDFDILVDFLCKALNKYYLDANFNEDPSIIELESILDGINDFVELSKQLKSAKKIDDLFLTNKDIEKNYLRFKNANETKAKDFAIELETHFSSNFNFNGRKYKTNMKWSDDPNNDAELKEAFNFFLKFKIFLENLGSFKYKYLTTLYLKDFYEKWQKEKETKRNQTFNDMIRYVRESVLKENSPLKDSLRKKYKYAIIDEFQDTNQIQFDIFSNIFMCDNHNIIVVGDPKQSIYSFQGADIQVYYKAKKAIEDSGGIVCDLNKNYRSTSDMVNLCNELFKYYDFDGTEFNACDSLNESKDHKSHKVLYDNKPISAFWIDNKGDLEEDSFACHAVEAIVDCCSLNNDGKTRLQIKDSKDSDFRNVSFKDFAVLARTRSEMIPIENALKEVGVPFIRYKDQSLFAGKECADWIALLTAINSTDFTGRNRKIFKKVLFTQFFGLSIKLSSNEIFEADDNEQIRLVKKWRIIAEERKWEDLFDDIIVGSGIIDRMTSLSQIQSLGIYKQISNFCIDFLSNGHSLDELIKQLGRLASGSSGDDVENGGIVEKATNFDCVQIMTMHASKGLQFPVTICVCGFKQPKGDSVFTYHIEENQINKHVLSFSSNEQTAHEQIEEWKRLFYVAYTRAQFVMMLPNYEKFSNGMEFLKDSLTSFMCENNSNIRFLCDSGNAFIELKPKVKEILEKGTNKSEEDDDSKKNDQDKILKEIIDISRDITTYKHSYSSFSHSNTYENEFDENEQFEGLEKYDQSSIQTPSTMNSLSNHDLLPSGYPKGSKAGSALHEIFEVIDFQNYKENLESIIYEAFKNQNLQINEANIKATVNMIENVLEAEIPVIKTDSLENDRVFKLSSINKNDKKSEVEFNFNINDEKLKNYCNGFIDLIFEKDNKYYLLDWKSDCLNENFTSYVDNDVLKKHVDESYSIQRVLYSYCLVKWLKSYYKGLSESEVFNSYFGGIYYVFIRGCLKGFGNGIYCQTWKSWDDLEKSFNEIVNDRIGGKNNG